MNCKNCTTSLLKKENFCPECGAKVITKRITTKSLISDAFKDSFGWDNKYFVTVKKLITSPEIILKKYIDGTRKKYVRPFLFLAINTAITIIFLNVFSDQYLQLNRDINESQRNFTAQIISSIEKGDQQKLSEKELEESIKKKEIKAAEQLKLSNDIQLFILKYLNIITFALLPFYTLVAYLVYRKPYNYGEHLIINTYLQAFNQLISLVCILFAMVFSAHFIYLTFASSAMYYLYAYSRLYQHGIGKAFLKLLKFIGITAALSIILMIIAIVCGIIFAILFK